MRTFTRSPATGGGGPARRASDGDTGSISGGDARQVISDGDTGSAKSRRSSRKRVMCEVEFLTTVFML
jgi:hypothetical protein